VHAVSEIQRGHSETNLTTSPHSGSSPNGSPSSGSRPGPRDDGASATGDPTPLHTEPTNPSSSSSAPATPQDFDSQADASSTGGKRRASWFGSWLSATGGGQPATTSTSGATQQGGPDGLADTAPDVAASDDDKKKGASRKSTSRSLFGFGKYVPTQPLALTAVTEVGGVGATSEAVGVAVEHESASQSSSRVPLLVQEGSGVPACGAGQLAAGAVRVPDSLGDAGIASETVVHVHVHNDTLLKQVRPCSRPSMRGAAATQRRTRAMAPKSLIHFQWCTRQLEHCASN
jgi:hypothetical protein